MSSNGVKGESNNRETNSVEMYENDSDIDDNDIETIRNDKGAHRFKMEIGQVFVSVEDLMMKVKNINWWEF